MRRAVARRARGLRQRWGAGSARRGSHAPPQGRRRAQRPRGGGGEERAGGRTSQAQRHLPPPYTPPLMAAVATAPPGPRCPLASRHSGNNSDLAPHSACAHPELQAAAFPPIAARQPFSPPTARRPAEPPLGHRGQWRPAGGGSVPRAANPGAGRGGRAGERASVDAVRGSGGERRVRKCEGLAAQGGERRGGGQR